MTRDPAVLASLLKELRQHLKLVVDERSAYRSRRTAAKNNPQERLSIILDGTSQAEYSVPHWGEVSKSTSVAHKMQTHFVGAIAHGIGNFLYGLDDGWKHDGNLTIEVLHRTLENIESTGNSLPPRLDLQMDNCWRENKNR